jgi:CD109 antigen
VTKCDKGGGGGQKTRKSALRNKWTAPNGKVECQGTRSNQELEANSAQDSDELDTPNDRFESIIRKDFPETWIFESYKVGENGNLTIEKELPDSITIWDISGFSLSNEYGFGIAKPATIIVKQNFFLMVHLPYSIRVGEILKIDVTVFNKFDRKSPIDVDVTLFKTAAEEVQIVPQDTVNEEENDEDQLPDDDENNLNTFKSKFDFYKVKEKCSYVKIDDQNNIMKNRITIKHKSATLTSFYIKATEAGNTDIKVRAEIVGKSNFYDEVHRKLRVRHEGVTQYKNYPYLFDLRKNTHDSYEMSFNMSQDAIKSSIKIEASVIGDLVGQAAIKSTHLM